MSRILFVYPNRDGYPIIPLGISILAGILKHHRHTVDLFDITFMLPGRMDYNAVLNTGVVKKIDKQQYWGRDYSYMDAEFRKKINIFKPDLLAFSIIENNYGVAKHLFKIAKDVTSTPIIVGGIFPTVAPKYFIEDKNVDFICIGEGEFAMLELADRLEFNNDYSDILNLIVKKNGKIIRNHYNKYYNWEPPINQNWEIFDMRHLQKPFVGKVWQTGFFELSRGCPFKCAFCTNHAYQKIFKSLGRYHREKPIRRAIDEMVYMKKEYSLEFIFFYDENFLMMSDERFDEFCLNYRKKIGLPFHLQTRAETLLTEDKVKQLKDANCITVGVGVESGSEKIRHRVLNKVLSDDIYIKAFENCHRFGIRTSANVMIGLPFETERDVLETIEFCKKLKAESIGLSIFAPYHGTGLYDICVKEGFIEDGYYDDISTYYKSMLKMPQFPKDKIEELYYKFGSLVYQE